MTVVEFGVMFGLGLISSLHCVQMCGPIVLSYSVALETLTGSGNKFATLLGNHLAYNAGRILTYSALGAAFGFAGHAMGLLGRVAGFGHTVAIVCGALMILVGISMLGLFPAGLLAQKFLRIPTMFMRKAGTLLSARSPRNRFLLGAALGFLPCGLIYAALLKAMATGTGVAGALTMLAFGLGTAGALIVLGMFSSALRLRLDRWGSQFAAVGVTLMGAFLVWRGTMPAVLLEHHMHAHH